MAIKKYPAPNTPPEKPSEIVAGGIVDNKDHVVRLYKDGTLEAENIRERESLGLSLELSEKGNKYYFSRKIDEQSSIEYVPNVVHKQFRSTNKRNMALKNAFAEYEGEVKRFAVKNLDRYKSLRKFHKKQVDKILASKNEYIFAEKRAGAFWNQVYIDSTQFGPYNYDTKLVVTKDLDYINDLIVIRTGAFAVQPDETSINGYSRAPQNNRIVWVSPHEKIVYSGAGHYFSSGHTLTGEPMDSGLYSGRTFRERHLGIVNSSATHALSSKYARILTDTQLKSEMSYQMIHHNNVEKKETEGGVNISPFYYIYDEYKKITDVGIWDGVVPSGASLSIECWSTNPRYIGFDGNIQVQPVDSSVAEGIDISEEITGTALHNDYQASLRLATDDAKRKFYKKVNKILLDKGIKKLGRRKVKYDKMLERVAQNVYDGLGTSRNEHTARMQGLDSLNSEDVPVYYDGTSKVYDGTKGVVAYDYTYTTDARLAGSGLGTTMNKSSGGSSGGTY
jgi:hypothetical protein